MVVRTSSDLRQMGHRQHLPVNTQLLHEATDSLGHGATHAGIHLVKNKRLCGAKPAGRDRDRQRHAGQLTARSHFVDRPGRTARMPRHQKADLFQATLRRLSGSLQCHFEPAPLHTQPLHGLGDGCCQPRCGFSARLGELPGLLHIGVKSRRARGFQPGQIAGSIELLQFLFPGQQQIRQLRRVSAVASGQGQPQGHALIEFAQALGVELGLAQVAPQGVNRVLHLRQT